MVELIHKTIQLHKPIQGETTTDLLFTNSKSFSNTKILVIPGNPGIVSFYIEFIKTLHAETGYDIVGISHIGHCGRVKNKNFSVEDQIQHKSLVIDYLLDQHWSIEKDKQKDIEFILIGHSVGSYVSLKLLSRFSHRYQFRLCCNLFPTFRHLYNGLSPFIKLAIYNPIRWSFANFLHYIPQTVTNQVFKWILSDDETRIGVSQKINYDMASNILYMAYTEALDIREVDSEVQSVFDGRLTDLFFIYGQTDNYTPPHFYEELKKQYPSGNIEYASKEVPHAFVLSHSKPVAIRVSEFINQKCSNTKQ
ncbi:hypothetical protein DLAC_07050 [Tieghemostelium lacteum]|uniref:Lipid droplet-associated serine hydrolase n=1 Tax=Tieghemostelium lacteum TaxID=361077 RepID=A0A151ZE90_TIELA|nr:hypothetical protein DLAC_07050 [Tieghemostelium lacteum]|eukprot:KYQ92204.1 hypothetical protein DLAC_07050 [Tieghemostelium lacteum]